MTYPHDTASNEEPALPEVRTCGGCKHSKAYHDGQGGRPCRAWDPDRTDNFCACAGWKPILAGRTA